MSMGTCRHSTERIFPHTHKLSQSDLFKLEGKYYFATSDYFSNFFELDHLRSTMLVSTIRKLKAHFARHSMPEQLVTDNGPQFSSVQWQSKKCCERGQEDSLEVQED